ncbi:EamA family transporter [Acidimangrovimonas pyrenivorans]|uniref:EamA family transporter n=1 Tax=Acidimangrovimonas pyrenivorans TaxID=2030798 RepID=A0ABV7ACI7_9RHOB
MSASWPFWAVLAAVFAALTAILAKLGVEDVPSNLATLIRTLVVVAALSGIVWATGEARGIGSVSPRSLTFLALSGLATGASWLCYFRALKLGPASRVAPIDKLSIVLVAVFAGLFLGEKLSGAGWFGVVLIAIGALLVANG